MISTHGRARPLGPRAPIRAARAALVAPSAGAAPVGRVALAFTCTLACALVAPPATAAVRLRIEAEGACPAPADLERSVGAWAAPEADESASRWRMRVRPARGGARLELFDPKGRVVLARSVASNDCQALARAFALIAHAHFLELGLVRPLEPEPLPPAPAGPLAPGGASTSGRPSSPGASAPGGPATSAAPPSPSASTSAGSPPGTAPATSAAPSASASGPVSSAPPRRTPAAEAEEEAKKAARPASRERGSLSFALGPGLVLPLPASAPPPLGFVDVTLRPPAWKLDFRLGAWLSTLAPTGQQATIRQRLGLASLTVGQGLGWPGQGWVFRPEVGAGLFWATVDARATEAPGRTRPRPALRAGLSTSYALTRIFSIRVDAALHVLPWADRYVVSPEAGGAGSSGLTEVGRGPRALLLAGVGLEGQTPFW